MKKYSGMDFDQVADTAAAKALAKEHPVEVSPLNKRKPDKPVETLHHLAQEKL